MDLKLRLDRFVEFDSFVDSLTECEVQDYAVRYSLSNVAEKDLRALVESALQRVLILDALPKVKEQLEAAVEEEKTEAEEAAYSKGYEEAYDEIKNENENTLKDKVDEAYSKGYREGYNIGLHDLKRSMELD